MLAYLTQAYTMFIPYHLLSIGNVNNVTNDHTPPSLAYILYVCILFV